MSEILHLLPLFYPKYIYMCGSGFTKVKLKKSQTVLPIKNKNSFIIVICQYIPNCKHYSNNVILT